MNTTIFFQQELHFSNHASKRMKQRNLTSNNANLIYWFGTEINQNEIYFTKKNAEYLTQCLSTKKSEASEVCKILKWSKKYLGTKLEQNEGLQQIIKALIGWKIVVEGKKVITCYRCTKKKQQKRLSRISN